MSLESSYCRILDHIKKGPIQGEFRALVKLCWPMRKLIGCPLRDPHPKNPTSHSSLLLLTVAPFSLLTSPWATVAHVILIIGHIDPWFRLKPKLSLFPICAVTWRPRVPPRGAVRSFVWDGQVRPSSRSLNPINSDQIIQSSVPLFQS